MLDTEAEGKVKLLINEAISEHREMVEERMNLMHNDLSSVRSELNGLRGEVHSINIATTDMRDSLKTIAVSMATLADLPDTWSKIKGFFAVVGWMRQNWLLFVIIGALIFVSFKLIGGWL